jgi:hypothetical protein
VINVVWNLLAVLIVGATSVVFAENPKDDSSPNTWDKAASGLGQQQLMGDHASNPPDLDPTQPGREGIGNVARLLGGDHPSDIPGVLCPPESTDPLCQ